MQKQSLSGLLFFAGLITLLTVSTVLAGQQARTSETDIARQLQNPLTNFSLVGAPFQTGPSPYLDRYDSHQGPPSLRKPLPFSFTPGWSGASQTVFPLYSRKNGSDSFGVHGLSLSALVAPADVPTITWGLGPALSFPTTNSLARNDKWRVGASGAVVYSLKAWVGGVFISNIWSFEGNSQGRDAGQMVIQPFLSYNLSRGWYLTSAPAITVDWQSNGSDAWTVPVGGGVGKVLTLYGQTLNIGAQGYVYPVHPTPGTAWAVQTTLQWLFPH